MLIVGDQGTVELDAVGDIAVVDGGGDALKDQVVGLIGGKGNLPVTGEAGQLERKFVEGLLIRDDRVIFLLVLVFIGGGRIGGGMIGQSIELGKAAGVGDLKIGVGSIEQQTEAAGVVDAIGKIREASFLIGEIMERPMTGGGVFDSQVVVVVGGSDEVI